MFACLCLCLRGALMRRGLDLGLGVGLELGLGLGLGLGAGLGLGLELGLVLGVGLGLRVELGLLLLLLRFRSVAPAALGRERVVVFLLSCTVPVPACCPNHGKRSSCSGSEVDGAALCFVNCFVPDTWHFFLSFRRFCVDSYFCSRVHLCFGF